MNNSLADWLIKRAVDEAVEKALPPDDADFTIRLPPPEPSWKTRGFGMGTAGGALGTMGAMTGHVFDAIGGGSRNKWIGGLAGGLGGAGIGLLMALYGEMQERAKHKQLLSALEDVRQQGRPAVLRKHWRTGEYQVED